MENIVNIIVFIIGTVIISIFAVREVQNFGLEKIRKYVYKGFLEAEKKFVYGDNTSKFEYVIAIAKEYIPAPFNCFITEKLLRRIVQEWFDLCKDFLDDGKINKTKK